MVSLQLVVIITQSSVIIRWNLVLITSKFVGVDHLCKNNPV